MKRWILASRIRLFDSWFNAVQGVVTSQLQYEYDFGNQYFEFRLETSERNNTTVKHGERNESQRLKSLRYEQASEDTQRQWAYPNSTLLLLIHPYSYPNFYES